MHYVASLSTLSSLPPAFVRPLPLFLFLSVSTSLSFQMPRCHPLSLVRYLCTQLTSFSWALRAHSHATCAMRAFSTRERSYRRVADACTREHAYTLGAADEGARMVHGTQSCRHRFASRIRINPRSSISLFCILTVVPSSLGVLIF